MQRCNERRQERAEQLDEDGLDGREKLLNICQLEYALICDLREESAELR